MVPVFLAIPCSLRSSGNLFPARVQLQSLALSSSFPTYSGFSYAPGQDTLHIACQPAPGLVDRLPGVSGAVCKRGILQLCCSWQHTTPWSLLPAGIRMPRCLVLCVHPNPSTGFPCSDTQGVRFGDHPMKRDLGWRWCGKQSFFRSSCGNK